MAFVPSFISLYSTESTSASQLASTMLAELPRSLERERFGLYRRAVTFSVSCNLCGRAVERVASNRVSDRGHVDANLMCSTSLDADANKRKLPEF